ncbi:MAG TPA: FAD-dependent monooxygenase [Sphingobium sp.]
MAFSVSLLRDAVAGVREVLVAGGGLAGSAAAMMLARAGRSVQLVERHAGPKDKICGEFLSIEAQDHLAALGVDLAAMGAVPVGHIRLVADGRTVETSLPFVARGISRRLLDETLLTLAASAGVQVERGVRVLEVGRSSLRTSKGSYAADTLLLATGKLPVREAGRAEEAMVPDAHVGFKMHWRAPARVRHRLGGRIELVLFPGGYAGLQLVEGGIANLCLVIRRNRLAQLGGRWDDVVATLAPLSPTLAALVDGEPLFDKPLTIANLAYGQLPREGDDDPVFRLGDQAAMTASLTGDGMAIALRSAWLAARCLLSGKTAAAYRRALTAMVGPQVRRGMILQRAAESPLPRWAGLGLLRMQPGLLRAVTRMTRLPALVPDRP